MTLTSSHPIGYTDRFSVAPGEQLQFKLSGDGPAVVGLVRLIHGDARASSGFVEADVPSDLSGEWALAPQETRTGSFGVVDSVRLRPDLSPLAGALLIYPTLLSSTRPQGLLAAGSGSGISSWDLSVNGSGALVLCWRTPDGHSGELKLDSCLVERVWHAVAFCLDADSRTVRLAAVGLRGRDAGTVRHSETRGVLEPTSPMTLLIAARQLSSTTPLGLEPRAIDTFNGKVERVLLAQQSLDPSALARHLGGFIEEYPTDDIVVDLDLGAQTAGWTLHDVGPQDLRGRLYNAPLRAVTSSGWDGESIGPTERPEHYSAVHFHADDLHHANWTTDRAWTVPQDLPSGLYALRIAGDDAVDRIPFVIRPPRQSPTGNVVAVLIPSYTYAAYANARECMLGKPYGDFVPERSPEDDLLAQHPEWGRSNYDRHDDGSGVCISSLSRPVPNLRPMFRAGLVNGPRHLSADLYLIDWLETLGIDHDVIADEDVHREGLDLLGRYRVLLTGSHPEYWTSEGLTAVSGFVDSGGRLMYMGGNGFYQVTSAADEVGTTVEVRREHGGTRTWDSAPGEAHHQFSGQYGGLWMYRGRGPHSLVGVGFVGEGWDGRNRPYARTRESREPRFGWAFDGIEPNALLGDHGWVMGGAAGDEIDCVDHRLGSRPETVVLATASGFSEKYAKGFEYMNDSANRGAGRHDMRADLAFTPARNGGAIFAASSISFTASLSTDDYGTPLATLCTNVLRTFMSGDTPWAD